MEFATSALKGEGDKDEGTELAGSSKKKKKNSSYISALEQYFPKWRQVFDKDQNAPTILIPPCADIEKSNANQSEGEMIGQNAERLFIKHFMGLRIGGLFLANIPSKNFLSAHRVVHSSAFEVDGLFLHDAYGIIVFECKCAKQGTSINESKHKARQVVAARQLKNIGAAIFKAFKSSTGIDLNERCINFVCLLTDSSLSVQEKNELKLQHDCALWDKEDILNEEKLREKLATIRAGLNGACTESGVVDFAAALKIFATKTAGCRALEYISPHHNAVAIHQKIAFQKSLTSTASDKRSLRMNYDDGQKQCLFLSSEQEEVLKNTDKFQVICGPPGTGKTLLLLLKALRLARDQNFKSKIYVRTQCVGHALDMKQFFKMNLASTDNIPIVHHPVEYEIDESYADAAVFLDESNTSDYPDYAKFRLTCPGPTFVCVTGGFFPEHLRHSEVQRSLAKVDPDGKIHYTFLATVYRGSANTVNYWKQILPKNSEINIGHRIRGLEVERPYCETYIAILEYLEKNIGQYISKSGRAACAIIVDSKSMIDIVRAKFNGSSGSVEEHVQNPNLIPIDKAENCLSMEWPVVFHIDSSVGLYSLYSKRFIASSRAMVKLVVLQRDYMTDTHEFQKMCMEKCLNIAELSYADFRQLVRQARKKVDEQEPIAKGAGKQTPLIDEDDEDDEDYQDYLKNADIANGIYRCNYWPPELKKHQGFNCDNFYEGIRILIDDDVALSKLYSAVYPYISYYIEFDDYSRPNMPEVLNTIWSDLTDDERKERWTWCDNLGRQLKLKLRTGIPPDADVKGLRNELGADDYYIFERMSEYIAVLTVWL